MNANAKWWAGLAAAVLVALGSQAHSVPEPWGHVFGTLGVVGAAAAGYMIQRPTGGTP